MEHANKKLIAVVGATGQQGGAVVRALQARNQFKVRALTRNPAKHRQLADEVVEADLSRPETLKAAFAGVHGVFLVTNWAEQGADELKHATAAVRAAKDAGVKHFVWSTLPDVEAISGGKFHVPHFTDKVFASFFPGAAKIMEMFGYFQAHTYLGSDSRDQIAFANKIASRQPTKLAAWARVNFPASENAHSAAR